MRQKDSLSQELLETERQLAALKAELEAKDLEVETIKEEMLVQGGHCAAQATRISSGLQAAKRDGTEVLEEARQKVAMLEKQTGEDEMI